MATSTAVAATVLSLVSSASAQNLVSNPGFEAPAILGAGQTAPTSGAIKPINVDPNHPGYLSGISGISNWSIAFVDPIGVDAGLGADYLTAGQFAFINNWNRHCHQTLGDPITASTTYTVSSDALLPGSLKAGRLQLIAGSYVGNELAPGSVVLDEITFADADWTLFKPDVVLAQKEWTSVSFEYESPSAGGVLGMPLVISFTTEAPSAGPVYFDNLSVTAVPSAGSLAVLGLVGCSALRRRPNR